MFRLFKRMFSGAHEAQVVDYLDGMLTFRALSQVPPGKVTLRVRLGEQSSQAVVRLERSVAANQLCCAKLLGPGATRRRLASAFPGNLVENPTWIRRVLRVLSPDLPGFRASSRGIGPDGILLEVDGEVEEGAELALDVELDDNSWEPLQLMGVVRRTRTCGSGCSLVEVGFCGMGAPERNQWMGFLESRRALLADASGVTQQQLAG